MGAGSPANTGEAGAIHRVACFAGEPAPTGFGVAYAASALTRSRS
ncbi:diguanylate cyclase [Pseudomonas oryziphila]|uniref:Diguanylate cyclase n=1 Tax=Pseudomonas entomophila TaxID=312306 RepID=A0A3Q8U4L8_9PSED|nr:diguanylate cyclase [Pseudomonas oryziphila]